MKIPEGYRPRRGDVVLVPATVKLDYDDVDENVHLKVEYASVGMPLEKLAGIQSLKFDVGDKVRHRDDHESAGQIIALCDACAWLKSPDGGFATFDTIDLEPMPREAAIEEPPPAPAPDAEMEGAAS